MQTEDQGGEKVKHHCCVGYDYTTGIFIFGASINCVDEQSYILIFPHCPICGAKNEIPERFKNYVWRTQNGKASS